MSVWSELVGTRRDLRLKGKWFHRVAVGLAAITSVVIYLMIGGFIVTRPVKLTKSNSFNFSLLRHAITRHETTTLANLYELSPYVGVVNDAGEATLLPQIEGPDTIRCESQAVYTATQTVKIGGVVYRAIPDRAGQPASESRHCVAAPPYAQLVADSVTGLIPDGTEKRKRDERALVSGIIGVSLWLVIYWNLYYRGIMPFYARYRRARRRRRFQESGAR